MHGYFKQDFHHFCDNLPNKRPMSHIVHLRNQFKFLKKHIWEELWLYHNIDKERKKLLNLHFKNLMAFICETLSFFTQGCFMPSSVEIGPMILEEKILKFWLFHSYLPVEKGMALHMNKLESPSPFVPSLVEIGPVVLEKKTKMWKVYRGTTDNRWSEKLTWTFSSVLENGIN